MREILFRAKTFAEWRWVHGSYILHQEGKNQWPRIYDPSVIFKADCCPEIRPETLGQFTGLLDKNGKKIFEGDIVKDYSGRVEKCVYLESKKRLMFVGANYARDLEFAEESEYEVIGNIHDNPELLNEQQ